MYVVYIMGILCWQNMYNVLLQEMYFGIQHFNDVIYVIYNVVLHVELGFILYVAFIVLNIEHRSYCEPLVSDEVSDEKESNMLESVEPCPDNCVPLPVGIGEVERRGVSILCESL